MDKLIGALGLDIKILISQLINFVILMAIMYKFGFKPMLKLLDDRKNKIEEGVKNAKKAEEKLVELEEREKEIIRDAKKEALKVIEEAKQAGEEKREQIIKKAKEEIGEIINSEKEKMRSEKASTLKEIKREIADLIILSLEKVIPESVDAKKDKELIKKAIKNIK